jgi:hypothetical protein
MGSQVYEPGPAGVYIAIGTAALEPFFSEQFS